MFPVDRLPTVVMRDMLTWYPCKDVNHGLILHFLRRYKPKFINFGFVPHHMYAQDSMIAFETFPNYSDVICLETVK
jgi:hypothetical protein